MCKNFCAVVIARRVAEGEERILRANAANGRKGSACIGHELRIGHRGGLRAVDRVPENRGAGDVVVGVNRAGIENRDGGRRVPEERVGRIGILSHPAHNGFDHPRAKSREGRCIGSRENVAAGGNLNLQLLLVEYNWGKKLVRVKVNMICNSHSTINHTELLNLELGYV